MPESSCQLFNSPAIRFPELLRSEGAVFLLTSEFEKGTGDAMQRTDTFLAKLILRNAALLTQPPLAISFGPWSLLPKTFGP